MSALRQKAILQGELSALPQKSDITDSMGTRPSRRQLVLNAFLSGMAGTSPAKWEPVPPAADLRPTLRLVMARHPRRGL